MQSYPIRMYNQALPYKRYGIEPQRDTHKGVAHHADGSIYFVRCEEHEAERWAVFEHDEDFPGEWMLVADWDTKAEAMAYVAGLR